MKRLTLVSLAVCSIIHCHSQTDFRKGFVITHQGDTLHGLVDYREGTTAYRWCTFKTSKNDNPTTYEPGEITGYGFTNDKYFQARLITTTDKIRKIVFLEVIVKGLVILYRHEDFYLLEKGDQGLYPLVNESVEGYSNGQKVIRKTNSHIAVMNMLLFDCIELRNGIRRTKLTERNLTTLVAAYNRCKGQPPVIYKETKPWFKVHLGIAAGMNVPKMKIASYMRAFGNPDARTEGPITPLAGFTLNMSSPRISERLSFQADLFYVRAIYYLHDSEGDVDTNGDDVGITQDKINFPIGARYTFPERKMTPYLNAGLFKTFRLHATTSWIRKVETDQEVETYSDDNLFLHTNFNRAWSGWWTGLGGLIAINNRLNAVLEFRYARTPEIHAFSSVLNESVLFRVTDFTIMAAIRLK